MLKICNTCKIEKDSLEFHKSKAEKDGFAHKCKVCVKEYHRANKEHIKTKRREWYAKDPEKHSEKRKEHRYSNIDNARKTANKYRINNKEKVREWAKKDYDKNKEAYKKRAADYYKNNKEHCTAINVEYVAKNKEKTASYQSMYYSNNIEKIKKYNHTEKAIVRARLNQHQRRYEKKSTSDGTLPEKIYPLPSELIILLEKQNNKCNNCGCDISTDRHLDHHIPLSMGGKHSLSNVVWLCPSCNLTKSGSMPDSTLSINVAFQ